MKVILRGVNWHKGTVAEKISNMVDSEGDTIGIIVRLPDGREIPWRENYEVKGD